jgi:hypothetical protein
MRYVSTPAMRHVPASSSAPRLAVHPSNRARLGFNVASLMVGAGLALIFAACATAEDVEDDAYDVAEQFYNGGTGAGATTASAKPTPVNPPKPTATTNGPAKPGPQPAPKPTATAKPAPATPMATAKPTTTAKPATPLPTAGGMGVVGGMSP